MSRNRLHVIQLHTFHAVRIFRRERPIRRMALDGWSPLHKAAANGQIKMVKLLLAIGANPKAEYQDGITPLDIAIKNKHDEIVTLLIAYR